MGEPEYYLIDLGAAQSRHFRRGGDVLAEVDLVERGGVLWLLVHGDELDHWCVSSFTMRFYLLPSSACFAPWGTGAR